MSDLGTRLKRAREARAIALRDVATRTKISVSALEALERNDVSKLPGGIFGRAFVRTYAIEVGLDPDEVVKDFLADLGEAERLAAERGAIRPEITADDRAFLERQRRALHWLRIGVVIVAILAVALLVWQLRAAWGRPVASVPVIPATPAAPVETAMAVPAAVPSPGVSAAVLPVETMPARAIVAELEMTEDAWLYAEADGSRLMSQMMRIGERRRLEADRVLFLDVGNAGGVRWVLNGKPAKALGRSGVHLRVTLTPANIGDYVE